MRNEREISGWSCCKIVLIAQGLSYSIQIHTAWHRDHERLITPLKQRKIEVFSPELTVEAASGGINGPNILDLYLEMHITFIAYLLDTFFSGFTAFKNSYQT